MYIRIRYIFILLLSGCGYTFNTLIPPYLKSLAIKDVENLTMNPNINYVFKTALLNAFIKDGNYRLTNTQEADAVLSIKILSYSKTPQSYDATQNVYQYKLSISYEIRLEDIVKKRTLITGVNTEYIIYDRDKLNETQALDSLSKKFASEILRRSTMLW